MAACCASKKLRYVFGALLIAFGAMLIVMTQLSAETLGGETSKALLEVTGAVGTCVFGVLGLFTEGVYFSEHKHVYEDEKLMGKRGIFNLKFAGRIVGLLGLLTGPLFAFCSPMAAVSVTGGGCLIWLLTCIPQLNYSWVPDELADKIKQKITEKENFRKKRKDDEKKQAETYKEMKKVLGTPAIEDKYNLKSKFTEEDIKKAEAFCEDYERKNGDNSKTLDLQIDAETELILKVEPERIKDELSERSETIAIQKEYIAKRKQSMENKRELITKAGKTIQKLQTAEEESTKKAARYLKKISEGQKLREKIEKDAQISIEKAQKAARAAAQKVKEVGEEAKNREISLKAAHQEALRKVKNEKTIQPRKLYKNTHSYLHIPKCSNGHHTWVQYGEDSWKCEKCKRTKIQLKDERARRRLATPMRRLMEDINAAA